MNTKDSGIKCVWCEEEMLPVIQPTTFNHIGYMCTFCLIRYELSNDRYYLKIENYQNAYTEQEIKRIEKLKAYL